MGPTRGPPGSCRPQMGPMMTPWTLLSFLQIVKNSILWQYVSLYAVSWPTKFSTAHRKSFYSRSVARAGWTVFTLCVLTFSTKKICIMHVYTIFIISPHWYHTGSWNPSSTKSVSWVLMSWRRKDPGYKQRWCWLCWTGIIRSPHVKG